MRNIFANLGVLFVSCLVGLFLCEVSLRLFYPKYRHLADPQIRQDAKRLWTRKPHARSWAYHPDTTEMHPFHHNNLALRQHRNFSEEDLNSAINVGFFGDSFVENLYLAAPYSFTEPLDYLLNKSGQPFNVLNFGVHGYGPGQSFLHYTTFRHVEDLDFVVFAYYHNDLDDLANNALFALDDAGQLVQARVPPSSRWVRLLSRLHLFYLLSDGSERFSAFIEERGITRERSEDVKEQRYEQERSPSNGTRGSISWAVFQQLLRRWKQMVESNGGNFYVMMPLDSPVPPFLAAVLAEEDIEMIDLYDCLGNADPAHTRRQWRLSPYRFKNNGHLNEAGNQEKAVCLYRGLEEPLRLPTLAEAELRAALHRYYAAFEGWMPPNAGGGGGTKPIASQRRPAFGRNMRRWTHWLQSRRI